MQRAGNGNETENKDAGAGHEVQRFPAIFPEEAHDCGDRETRQAQKKKHHGGDGKNQNPSVKEIGAERDDRRGNNELHREPTFGGNELQGIETRNRGCDIQEDSRVLVYVKYFVK